MLKNGSQLYVFEHKDGKRCILNGFRAFARLIKADVGNLHRTFKHKNYTVKGWRLVEIFSLLTPDWDIIYRKMRKAHMPDGLVSLIEAVENGTAQLKKYGRQAWSTKTLLKKNYVRFVKEKTQEALQEQKQLQARKFQYSGCY